MPYATAQYARGRQVSCPFPEFASYSPSDPYGIAGSCTTSAPVIYGNGANWTYTPERGPAFNLEDVQRWAYPQDAEFLFNLYLLYGGANPVTCPDAYELQDGEWVEVKSCVECGECFLPTDGLAGTCESYAHLEAALNGAVSSPRTKTFELSALFIHNYGMFLADMKKGRHNPCEWGKAYWPREWDTTAIYSYTVGSMKRFIDNLARPLKKQGTILLNSRVVELSSAGGGKSVRIRTEDGYEYNVDYLIYAAPPEELSSGRIVGNYVPELLKQLEFQSVYSVPVTTATLNVKDAFWLSALPNPDQHPNASQWVLLRGFGDGLGCAPRVEVRWLPYGKATLTIRYGYNDFQCQDILVKHGDPLDTGTARKLYEQALDDLSSLFKIPKSEIPEYNKNKVEIDITNFATGWYFLYENTTATAASVRDWAVAPLGANVPICLAHEAWGYEYLGWAEAGMRGAQACVDRLLPGSSECWSAICMNCFRPVQRVPRILRQRSGPFSRAMMLVTAILTHTFWAQRPSSLLRTAASGGSATTLLLSPTVYTRFRSHQSAMQSASSERLSLRTLCSPTSRLNAGRNVRLARRRESMPRELYD